MFADRGGLFVCDDPLVAVATLVKMTTGLTEVNADSYVRQAEEIFSKDHPLPFPLSLRERGKG